MHSRIIYFQAIMVAGLSYTNKNDGICDAACPPPQLPPGAILPGSNCPKVHKILSTLPKIKRLYWHKPMAITPPIDNAKWYAIIFFLWWLWASQAPMKIIVFVLIDLAKEMFSAAHPWSDISSVLGETDWPICQATKVRLCNAEE